ncbi:tail protein X [Rhodospirillum centenum]|uniref:Phage Tail Protein X n=1 Tax=Rhodospirillum centenum (strain ATCC 51521 / SW) TaxID=414684 RepID=B6IMG6_RHOCS|nr:tail protein X [Rhodospirillum centenum]ACI98545.1 phage Tail Protein X [Rhodospirillum centenum SW]
MDYLEHITQEGERWDAISWRYYGDPHRYEEIIKANPEVPIARVLPSGLVLRIPLIEVDQLVPADDLPPWKR